MNRGGGPKHIQFPEYRLGISINPNEYHIRMGLKGSECYPIIKQPTKTNNVVSLYLKLCTIVCNALTVGSCSIRQLMTVSLLNERCTRQLGNAPKSELISTIIVYINLEHG